MFKKGSTALSSLATPHHFEVKQLAKLFPSIGKNAVVLQKVSETKLYHCFQDRKSNLDNYKCIGKLVLVLLLYVVG